MIGAVYTATDYLCASILAAGILVFVAATFLGLLRSVLRLRDRIMGEVPASAQEAAQRVTDGPQYAAYHNMRQGRGGRRG